CLDDEGMIAEQVYLGLGSNIGNARETVGAAIAALRGVLEGVRSSALYRTAPVGVLDQPEFINAVITGVYHGSGHQLLAQCLDLEARHGRNRGKERRHGPRTLDIDILLFGSRRLFDNRLEIPHPRMRERQFVLVPLLEISPDLVEPGSGIAFSAYLDSLPEAGIYYDSDPRVYS
ncbi:MAG: 2-amino-4-hydroxy-6-hydroxymethyldihydropteridine diphosphokinase, partial [Spirochaetota bacterium]